MEATALLLTGTVGAGKTTTADRIGQRLRSLDVAHAVIDLDAIRAFWPTPADDPFESEMELRNLAPLASNYLAGGARRLVLAGVCGGRENRARFETALGVPLLVCRLRVAAGELDARLRSRHRTDASGLGWHLARAGELDGILDRVEAADVEVHASGMTRDEAAAAVLAAVGWT